LLRLAVQCLEHARKSTAIRDCQCAACKGFMEQSGELLAAIEQPRMETAATAQLAEPSPALLAYREAMQAGGVPHEALQVYDSNSYRRVGLASQYREVLYATTQRDGHPDIHGMEILRAMVAAFNAMLERSEARRSE
jgi:hypothetical protein